MNDNFSFDNLSTRLIENFLTYILTSLHIVRAFGNQEDDEEEDEDK